MSLLLAVTLLVTPTPAYTPRPIGSFFFGPVYHDPTVNLSAIRQIKCDEGAGTGFVVGNDILVTALHVANATNCKDAGTGKPLKTYHTEKDKDFALMAGDYPDYGPYIKVSCRGYTKGQKYYGFGYRNMFRMDVLTATGRYTPPGTIISGTDMSGMQILKGGIIQGQSGGPMIERETGEAVGFINANRWDDSTGKIYESYSYEFKHTKLCK